MYIKNNDAPRIDPCGASHLTLFEVENTLLYVTNGFLLAK